MITAIRILVGKAEVKRPLERHGLGWVNTVQVDLK
jgi:hypothetical protein